MKMKENEKFRLKLDIQKTKILISGPITAQQMEGETMQIPTHFILGGSKIIADCDCCHEIKTLSAWMKSCELARQHIQKQRHCFASKIPAGQSYGFTPVMYRCEIWTVKTAKHGRIDAFKLWCW